MQTLILATANQHKVEEIQAILGPSFNYMSLKNFPDAPKTIEDGATFEANATKKAVELAKWLPKSGHGMDTWVLADDSGLEVDALNGAPGVHSARFAALDSGAAGNSKDRDNNAKLLRLLERVPPERRTARFRCVIALTPVAAQPTLKTTSPVCESDEHELSTQLFSGACEGVILSAARGGAGFGYDPLFQPTGFDKTFAELGAGEKNRLSHRAQALAKMRDHFQLA